MKGRIKHADLDHLLRLVQAGLPGRADARRDTGAAGNATGDDTGSHAGDATPPDHAFWNANHSYWADKLRSDTDGSWTPAHYAAAASIINAAEYQQVLFRDIASALTQGLSGDSHERVDFSGSGYGRFAGSAAPAAYSEFDETIDLLDAASGRAHHVRISSVLDDVRRSELVAERHQHSGANVEAIDGVLKEEQADVALAPKQINLGELAGGRARNGAPLSFNDVRGELYAQSGLSILLPYADWDDFRDRNHLSDDLIADIKAAYPDGFAAVDLWVGALAERPAVGGVGPTIAATLSAEIAQMKNASAQFHFSLLAGTHLASEISAQTWSDIVARNMGPLHFASFVEGGAEDRLGHVDHSTIFGTPGDDVLIGTDGDDVLHGGAGDDLLDGGKGADVLVGGAGNDTYVVDHLMDRVIETADGGDADTIQTTLDAFALKDAASDGSTDTDLDAAHGDAADAAAGIPSQAATGAGTAGDGASSDVPEVATGDTDEVPTEPGVEEDPLVDFDLSDLGWAINVENLTYIGDNDFVGWGNSANNVLIGGSEDDMLWGRGGDDVLVGNDGEDALFGGSGDDVLFAGKGDDWLDGGSGNDVLYLASGSAAHGEDDAVFGAYGNDTIVLRPGFGDDVVIGFDSTASGCAARDRLDVSAYTSLSADSIGAEIQIISSGPHTIITIGEDSITLLDVNANAIGKDDFIFG